MQNNGPDSCPDAAVLCPNAVHGNYNSFIPQRVSRKPQLKHTESTMWMTSDRIYDSEATFWTRRMENLFCLIMNYIIVFTGGMGQRG